MITEEKIEEWLSEQHELLTSLERLLVKQAEDHAKYAHESCERMHELNKMMANYIEIQKSHIDAYVKHLDGAVDSRNRAQKNASEAIAALRTEQEKSKLLVEIIRNNYQVPTASVTIGEVKK